MKKKPNYLLLIALGIFIGIIIGYIVAKMMNQSMFLKGDTQTGMKFEEIRRSYADTMRHNFRKEQKNLWYPLKTVNDSLLRGFWLDRKLIDSIAKQDIPYTGISIYFGKGQGARKREYSLVVVGTKNKGQGGVESLRTDQEDFGKYFDYVDPCPNKCGDSGNK